MTRVEEVEREVRSLSAEELSVFRQWFFDFDSAVWDRQIEDDTHQGKLADLADAALRDHRAGKTTEF